MGKPTGFLDYERKNTKAETPLQRIRHFHEFKTSLPAKEQQKQGGRCMDCGVPFCQNGTPARRHDVRMSASQSGAGDQ